MDAQDRELLDAARAAWERAYAPYSHYAVGAALRGQSGRIYPGVNVENAAYPMTICAERSAVVSAVSGGEREFTAIAVVTANGGTPCGACRQVLLEFAPGLRVIVSDLSGNATTYTMLDLLPHSFDASKLT